MSKAEQATAPKFEAEDFKKITLDAMCDYIETYYPDDKAWFKKVAYQDKDGNTATKYNHLNAARRFCEKYAPELLPKASKKKEPAAKRLESW